LSESYLGITTSTIYDACSLGSGIIGMFNGLLSIGGMYGDIVLNQLFGSCSSLVRGFSAGPMSGAKVGTAFTGLMTSTTANPAQIDETLGRSVVHSCLQTASFGESTGSDDASPYGGEVKAISITSFETARQSANIESMTNLSRINSILTAIRTAVRISYSSYDSALEIMEVVLKTLNDLLLKLGNDAENEDYADYGISIANPDSYESLQAIVPIFAEAMVEIGANLSKVIAYEVPPVINNSLVLAHDKYDDLDRESDIINRNPFLIDNPGFLPSGKEIEILDA